MRRASTLARVLRWACLLPVVIASPLAASPLVDVECPFAVAESMRGKIRCAELAVPRDAANPAAGSYRLALAVRSAPRPREGALPVVMFHGGPGQGLLHWFGTGFGSLLPAHDLVLFDMRGVGYSEPTLCAGTGVDVLRAEARATTAVELRDAQAGALEACRAEFAAGGHRIEDFATAVHAADAERIRAALGIPRWIALGASYGATAAADYTARHPDALAASVIAAVYAPDALLQPLQQTLVDALRGVGAQCDADPACRAAWGPFDALLAQARAQLAARPLEVPVAGIGVPGDVYRLTEDKLDRLLLGALTSPSGRAALPRLLDAARAGRAAEWGAVVRIAAAGTTELSYAGAFATDCRDRARHHAPAPEPPSRFGLLDPRGLCPAWGAPGESPRLPEGATAPILVLSGALDPLTPPAFGERVAASIGSAARALTVPAAGHGLPLASGCVGGLLRAFAADPAAPLDAACLADLRGEPFVTDVVAVPGLARLALAAPGEAPPWGVPVAALGLLLAIACGVLALPVVAWRARRVRAAFARPRMYALVAVIVLLAGLAGCAMVAMQAMQHNGAVLMFGLPTSAWPFALLPWLAALPALATQPAWRGGPRAAALAGAGVLLAIAGLASAGLLVLP